MVIPVRPLLIKLHIISFGIFAAVLTFFSCSGSTPERPVILVSPKGYAHAFWQVVKAGADSASREFPVDIIWNGPPNDTQIAEQITIIETYLNRNIDGLVLAAADVKALVPVVERAYEIGVPTVTIDSGIDSDVPVCFVATDNIEGAREAARHLAALIGNKGEVASIPFFPGAATSILREQGFLEELKNFPDIDLVATQYSMSDVAKAMAVTENILTAHPGLDGIFAAAENCAIGVMGALSAKGLSGKVKVVAFDASEEEITGLENDAIQALIVQDPFRMGYLGVKVCYEVLQGKSVPKRIDTGVTVVTKQNLYEPHIQNLLYPMGKP